MLDVCLGGKLISLDFFLMDCRAPYNGILGRDWITHMGVVASTHYQCFKFPLRDKVIKVISNRWLAHDCDERFFEEIGLSEVKDRQILKVLEK